MSYRDEKSTRYKIGFAIGAGIAGGLILLLRSGWHP